MKLALLLISTLILTACTSTSSNSYEDSESYSEDVVTSENWKCTSDCSGHEAGYEWAADKGITDPDDCGGKSNSFIEGCEAYANEN